MQHLKLFCVLLILGVGGNLNAANYYWVGGSGNWSDISHWATTSGGVITHNQAPTSADDVFFDENSFTAPGQTVTIQIDIAFVRNMDWSAATNNPAFQADANVRLNIYGTLELIPDMDFNFMGRTFFQGDQTDNTVNFAGHPAGQDITFDGSGSWTVNSAITVDSIFSFREGTLNTNGQAVSCQYFYSNTVTTRRLVLGASVITVTGLSQIFHGDPELDIKVAEFNATNLQIEPGTSVFDFTSELIDIWYLGSGTLNFNGFRLSNLIGDSRIIPWRTTPEIVYQELALNHRTLLNGSPTIEQLRLQAGKRYFFEAGQTFTINDLQAMGDCLEYVGISATDGGGQTTFNASSAAAIALEFVTLRNVQATGTATWTANNSIDLGGNDGWTINAKPEEQFYWIGGTGNWSNPANWSMSSGGPAGSCIPSPSDNVFFDANSFTANGQVVTIDIENAYCKSMDWTGATNEPELAGPAENEVHIFGSLTLIPEMNHSYIGPWSFESRETGNTITSGGQAFNYDVFFAGDGGEWILQDSLFVFWGLYFQSGTIRANGQVIHTNRLYSETQASRTLDLENSTLLFNTRLDLYYAPEWKMDVTNFELLSDASTIHFDGWYWSNMWFYGSGDLEFNNLVHTAYTLVFNAEFTYRGGRMGVDSLLAYSSMEFLSESFINYAELSAGKTYRFNIGVTQYIDQLKADGDCENGLVYLSTFQKGQAAFINLNSDFTGDRLSIQSIHQTGMVTATANNSIDHGDNSGWVFSPLESRTLYWVGGTGEWEESAHWSLSSGGPGGECIPTPVDDVIFDENSFTNSADFVGTATNVYRYCRNMTWRNVPDGVTIFGYWLALYGNLQLEPGINFNNGVNNFRGSGNYTIDLAGNLANDVDIEGDGVFELINDMNLRHRFTQRAGTFVSNGFDMSMERFFVEGYDLDKTTNLEGSHIEVFGELTNGGTYFPAFFVDRMELVSSDFTMEFSHPTVTGVRIWYNASPFGHLLFSGAQANAILDSRSAQIMKATFTGNGTILGGNTLDTLLFSAGKSYEMEAAQTQTINSYWQMIGNNCTPIELSSTTAGMATNVQMPDTAFVLSDFVQMRDNTAAGGAEFVAGVHSTDIAGSNQGWIFDGRPEFVEVGFLGEDRALCKEEAIALNAYNYSQNETYSWSTGSTDSLIVIDQPGSYSVQVTFLTGCIIQDAITILPPDDAKVDLPADTIACEGDVVLLDANIGAAGGRYNWQDGVTGPQYPVTEPGTYSVELDLVGCISKDSVTIDFVTRPVPVLGDDQSLCEGQETILDPATTAEAFLWSDGSTDATLSTAVAGTYWVEARNQTCRVRDSINVIVNSYPEVSLGADTLICENTTLALSYTQAADALSWQDNSTENNFTVSTPGIYWLDVTRQGCTSRDSIEVTYQALPVVGLGDDQTACEGMVVSLSSNVTADALLWSTGENSASIDVRNAGVYWLEATLNRCSARDSVNVQFNPFPDVALGPDVTLCEGDSTSLDVSLPDATYEWQDGSTNADFILTENGTYRVAVTVAGCTSRDTLQAVFLALPSVDIGDFAEDCEGETIDLESNVSGDAFLWSTNSSDAAISVSEAGTYWLEVTENGCRARDSIQVQFNAFPIVELGPDQTACEGTPIVLDAGAEGTWQDGTVGATYSATTNGIYRVSVDNRGCITEDELILTFNPLPSFSLGPDQTYCEGESTTLQLPAEGDFFFWENGTSDPQRTIQQTGLYALEVQMDGCSARDSIRISFAPLPQLELGPDTLFCEDESVELRPAYSGGTLIWEDDSRSDTYLVSRPGVYRAIVDNQGCITRDSLLASIRECTYFQTYIPNAFSPNEDGVNDQFLPGLDPQLQIVSYQLQVFDRWGNRLFLSTSPSEGWDGTQGGETLSVGVYLYVIEMEYTDDRGPGREVLSGEVSILK